MKYDIHIYIYYISYFIFHFDIFILTMFFMSTTICRIFYQLKFARKHHFILLIYNLSLLLPLLLPALLLPEIQSALYLNNICVQLSNDVCCNIFWALELLHNWETCWGSRWNAMRLLSGCKERERGGARGRGRYR